MICSIADISAIRDGSRSIGINSKVSPTLPSVICIWPQKSKTLEVTPSLKPLITVVVMIITATLKAIDNTAILRMSAEKLPIVVSDRRLAINRSKLISSNR